MAGWSFLAQAFQHGDAGVDFFFVLSGFIIAHAHAGDVGRPERLGRYLRNRFIRLYPIYWLYNIAILVSAAVGFSESATPHNTRDWVSVLTLVRLSHIPSPIIVAWTLFYEVVFYAIFATLIVNKKLGFVAIAAWLAVIIFFHLNSNRLGIAAPWASRLCLNFFIGMAACWAFVRINRETAVTALAVGIATIVIAFLTVGNWLSPSMFGTAIAIGCGMGICGAAAMERFQSRNVGILANLGSASYTLYLVHVNIGSVLLKALVRMGASKILPPDVLFAIHFVGTTAVAYLLYLLVEKPLLEAVKRGFSSLTQRDATQQIA